MIPFADNSEHVHACTELIERLCDGALAPEAFRSGLLAARQREADSPPLALTRLREALALDERMYFLVLLALEREIHCTSAAAPATFGEGVARLCQIYPVNCTVFTLFEEEHPFRLLWNAPDAAPLLASPLLLRREIVLYLTCGRFEAAAALCLHAPHALQEGAWLPLHEPARAALGAALRLPGRIPLVHGCAGAGKRTLVRRVCAQLPQPLILAQGRRLISARAWEHALLTARISGGVLCVSQANEAAEWETPRAWIKRLCVPCVLLSDQPDFLPGEFADVLCRIALPDALPYRESRLLWARRLNAHGFMPEALEPTGTYRMAAGEIVRASADAADAAALEGVHPGSAHLTHAVCVRARCGTLPAAQDAGALDRFVGEDTKNRLLSLLSFARQRRRLYEELGFARAFAYGRGVTALFHGPSGTGKTMAAEALAARLGLPLLRADVSQIVDKYVGETEKHLDGIFRAAGSCNCLLFFDEADALFSRRTEIQSSHDKYANLSTSYLLQKLEEYEGVAILATNLIQNFDEAFLRRIRFVIRFPMPGRAERESLWRGAFPAAMPAAENVDFGLLAAEEISPARIQETALLAASLALEEGRCRVEAGAIARALTLELMKEGRAPLRTDFARSAEHGSLDPDASCG